jgi:hypothetical protein
MMHSNWKEFDNCRRPTNSTIEACTTSIRPFGYIHVTSDTGYVRYGRGPVVPHDPGSLTDQRYAQFAGWVPIEPHHVPDERWSDATWRLAEGPLTVTV